MRPHTILNWTELNWTWLLYLKTKWYCICHVIPYGEFGSPYLGKATAAARAVLPIPTSKCIFLCVQTVVCLPVFGILNMHSDVDACNCTQGLYEHCKRVCTDSWLREKNDLAALGNKICVSWLLCLAFQFIARIWLPYATVPVSTGILFVWPNCSWLFQIVRHTFLVRVVPSSAIVEFWMKFAIPEMVAVHRDVHQAGLAAVVRQVSFLHVCGVCVHVFVCAMFVVHNTDSCCIWPGTDIVL